MGPVGLEPTIQPPSLLNAIDDGTPIGTLNSVTDTDLKEIIARWPTLPDHVKSTILWIIGRGVS